MKKLFLPVLLCLLAHSIYAQNARVQIIHNSADLAATEVDVYLDDVLTFDDFAFRTATEFINVPAGINIEIDIAPGNSSSSGDSVFNTTVNFVDGETYVVVADGIVDTPSYSPAPAFGLEIFPLGQETALDPANTDVLVHHGSTDAPAVDVVEVTAGTIVSNIAYTEFQGYIALPTEDYAIEIQPAGSGTTVAAYELPLSTLSLDGAAVVAVASGFLDPSVNNDGPAFGIWVALPSGGDLVELPASTARVQVVHNSPDAAAEEVDVYLNGALALDDFAFRTATEFLDFPAGVEIEIAVAPGNSVDVGDAIATFPLTLTREETYIVVADGIVDTASYDPAPAFGLEIYDMGREAATDPANTDLLVHHGATDAPIVDIVEVGVGAGTIVNDISYTKFIGYLELPTDDYALEVRDGSGAVTVAAYEAPLASLGLQGAAAVAVASGFLDPSVNNDGAPFGIWVALPSGGDLVELPISTSRVQVIHNSADAAASEVDVYLNGDLIADDFAFRTASPFLDIPSSLKIDVAIAPGNSTSVDDAIATFPFTLERNETYIVVADGIVSPSGYNPATPFSLEVYGLGREEATNPANTDVLVHHGSTDAPTVDIVEIGAGAGTIVDDLSYSEFQGYLELPTADYRIDVRDETGTTTVATYDVPLALLELDGAALVAVASGFLNPANNSDGAPFGIWVALPDGGELIELPLFILNNNDFNVTSVRVYPNPTTSKLNIVGLQDNASFEIVDIQGRILTSEVSFNNNLINVDTLAAGMYFVIVNTNEGTSEAISFIKQ